MNPCQQLSDTLLRFKSYLLLRLKGTGYDIEGRATDLVLVPHGRIAYEKQSGYRIEGSARCDAVMHHFAYAVHPRFRNLQASSPVARLHLAALYAATSSALPESRLEMTGVEQASTLVQQSWTNAPLTNSELESLQQVLTWSSPSPALSLLCLDLHACSQQLSFLHPHGSDRMPAGQLLTPQGTPVVELRNAYLHQRNAAPDHPRRSLSPEEEVSVMAWRSVSMCTPWRVGELQSLKASANAVVEDQAKLVKYDKELGGLMVSGASDGGQREDPVHFMRKTCDSTIGTQMLEELKTSCTCFAGIPMHKLGVPLNRLVEKSKAMLRKVAELRGKAERRVLAMTNEAPDTYEESITRFRLMQAADELPLASLADLAQGVLVGGLLSKINPLLDKDSCEAVTRAAEVWLQWCTLEDRLQRLLAHAMLALATPTRSHAPLVQELQAKRLWSVREYPEWLVFEVEGRIQIRQRQFEVARLLLEEPGKIVQLNMGEGKTRVILPMLWLVLARKRDALVRVHFLSTLLPEATEFMRRHLGASVLGRRLYFMPFHRDIELDSHRLRRMAACLEECQRVGGMLMVAPEHRLSLHLKSLESRQQTCVGDAPSFDCPTQNFRFHDIFDESDVLLHHGYELVYAVGQHFALPSGPSRWNAAQMLLRALARDQALQAELLQAKAATMELDQECMAAYPKLRLDGGQQLDAKTPMLIEKLAEAVIQDPPYEMKWLALVQNKEHRARIHRCMVDKTVSAPDSLGDLQLSDVEKHDVLALRGFLAHGVFVHSLKKRFRVEYGLRKDGVKQLAVPYRAADTPSERSEFAHPDCQILLTVLSYYFDGLEQDQVMAAVAVLLQLGPNARSATYRTWFNQSKCDMEHTTRTSLCSVKKLDLSNPGQVQLLCQHYRQNPETINFFLNNCIFPKDTAQYPQMLRTSAWDLAENQAGTTLGFSGTNDHHRLLPLQVRQLFPTEPELAGTNGKMVKLILDNPDFLTLPTRSALVPAPGGARSPGMAVWEQVLGVCVEKGVDALIDSGGLMAGVSNQQVSKCVLPRLPDKFRAVTFYHVGDRCWKVLDREGCCEPKQASPIRTADTFAFFDESRCRGADLKLRSDAVAILTVGQKMCKDKLMQAAGRMRQLATGQRLLFLGAADLAARIEQLASSPQGDASRRTAARGERAKGALQLTSKELLRWVMHNTVQATGEGLVLWADKGSAFLTSKRTPQNAAFDQDTTLEASYALPLVPVPVLEVVERMQRKYLMQEQLRLQADAAEAGAQTQQATPSGAEEVLQVAQPEQSQSSLQAVLQHVETLGGQVWTERSTLDEECEREMEREEEEEEKKQEVVLPRKIPFDEKDWDVAMLLRSDDLHANLTNVVSLRNVLQSIMMAIEAQDAGTQAHEAEPATAASTQDSSVVASKASSSAASRKKNRRSTSAKASEREDRLELSDAIWCTWNFVRTLQESSAAAGDWLVPVEYLRPLDAVWQFPSGKVLLLSEREADSALRLLWTGNFVSRSASQGTTGSSEVGKTAKGDGALLKGHLRHLAFLRQDTDSSRMRVKGRQAEPLATSTVVCLQLFNGDTCYSGEERKAVLRKLLARQTAEEHARRLVWLRGAQLSYPHSDLELVKFPPQFLAHSASEGPSRLGGATEEGGGGSAEAAAQASPVSPVRRPEVDNEELEEEDSPVSKGLRDGKRGTGCHTS